MTDEDKTELQDGIRTDSALFRQQTAPESSSVVSVDMVKSEPVASIASVSNPASLSQQIHTDMPRQQAAVGNPQASQLAVGDILKDRFQVLEVIGEGGMGIVFKAADVRKLEAKSRNPYVAIKVLNPALAKNDVLITALQRECEKAHELSHPNIITAYDFDRDGDHVFMSMEYLVGRPLLNIIREAKVSGGLKLERAWPIIHKMGEALVYAHHKNIVHSDFKPGNVFVTDNGEVKVLDFGIASRHGQSDADETIFNARAEGGLTPPYASFEMINGSRADPRDDVYAFGLVVYELLTGRHPYDRKPASTVFLEQRSGHGTMPAVVPGLSRTQWQLLKSAIEILQEQRPQKLDAWLREFDPNSNSKWRYPVTGGIALLMLGAATFVWYQSNSNQTAREHEVLPQATTAESPEGQSQGAAIMEPPLASPGSDMQGVVGEVVELNGGLSRSLDGSPISYGWRLIAKPAGSNADLVDANTVSPKFIPDQVGHYTAELKVTDARNITSKPVSVSINVDRSATPVTQATEIFHEATSKDGVLSLAASKPQYHIGEELQLNFRSAKTGYLRVAYVSTTGEINELLPNKYQPSKVNAGVSYRIPPKEHSFKLQVTGPVGVDKIVAVFSESPIPGVTNIAKTDGSIVNELESLVGSSALIQFTVVEKNL